MNATTATTANTFAGKTAEEWRAEAKRSTKASSDSFDRCDTDGYLSQWAHNTMAFRYGACAQVAEDGGTMIVTALFKDGEMVPGARNVDGRYGWSWVYDDENGRAVWLSESKAQTAAKRRAYFMRKHEGFTLGTVRVEAALNTKSGSPFPVRDAVVEIIETDDQNTDEDHNGAY